MKHLILTIALIASLASCEKPELGYREQCSIVRSVEFDDNESKYLVTLDSFTLHVRENVLHNWTSKIGQEYCRVIFND